MALGVSCCNVVSLATPLLLLPLLLLLNTPCHAATHTAEDIEQPWGWQCESDQCVKKDRREVEGLTTLNTCKVTCGPSASLWPVPSKADVEGDVSLFLPENVDYELHCPAGGVENLLQESIEIFTDNIQRYNPKYDSGDAMWTGPWDSSTTSHLLSLNITVDGGDVSINLNTDESYGLTVTTSQDKTIANIQAATYFGARHALETLSQLIEYHETADALMVVTTAQIEDSPAFPYRGILLDSARNYVSLSTLKRTLDAMAASKLNTLHWHMTDTQSFPLLLESLPNMAKYGAYSPSQVYTVDQVLDLKQYALVRGVRLLPELDAPAHAGNGWQWGTEADLGNLAVCVNQEPWWLYCSEPPCGQLNIANDNLYDVLGKLYKDIMDMFSPLDLFHFGGDEVNINCWNSTKEINDWMTENGFGVDRAAYLEQWAVFQDKARQELLKTSKNPDIEGILFTSALTAAHDLQSYINASQYIIQIWTAKDDKAIKDLLTRGYRVIFSNYDALYLDCGVGAWVDAGHNWCSPYKTWQIVYDNSPYAIAEDQTGSHDYDHLILGGEAALWTEQADDATVDSKLWPRGAALAERLWSNPESGWHAAETRFIEHRQRLVQRGIQAERLQPQWCYQNQGTCHIY